MSDAASAVSGLDSLAGLAQSLLSPFGDDKAEEVPSSLHQQMDDDDFDTCPTGSESNKLLSSRLSMEADPDELSPAALQLEAKIFGDKERHRRRGGDDSGASDDSDDDLDRVASRVRASPKRSIGGPNAKMQIVQSAQMHTARRAEDLIKTQEEELWKLREELITTQAKHVAQMQLVESEMEALRTENVSLRTELTLSQKRINEMSDDAHAQSNAICVAKASANMTRVIEKVEPAAMAEHCAVEAELQIALMKAENEKIALKKEFHTRLAEADAAKAQLSATKSETQKLVREVIRVREVAKAVNAQNAQLKSEREEFEKALRDALSFAVAKGRATTLAQLMTNGPFEAEELTRITMQELEEKRSNLQSVVLNDEAARFWEVEVRFALEPLLTQYGTMVEDKLAQGAGIEKEQRRQAEVAQQLAATQAELQYKQLDEGKDDHDRYGKDDRGSYGKDRDDRYSKDKDDRYYREAEETARQEREYQERHERENRERESKYSDNYPKERSASRGRTRDDRSSRDDRNSRDDRDRPLSARGDYGRDDDMPSARRSSRDEEDKRRSKSRGREREEPPRSKSRGRGDRELESPRNSDKKKPPRDPYACVIMNDNEKPRKKERGSKSPTEEEDLPPRYIGPEKPKGRRGGLTHGF